MCFLDMTKAVERGRLKDALEIIRTKGLKYRLINLNINAQCRIKIRLGNMTTVDIHVNTGIRLSPFIFNLIMHKIV